MSTYLQILAVNRPYATGTDINKRQTFSCNFEAKGHAPVADMELEIVKLIVNAGLGAFGTDLFVGPGDDLPTNAGPIVQLLDTGGMAPDETHDGAKKENISFQIFVRALSYTAGRTRALAIWRLLDGQRNITVVA